jgi:hypothetical protein
MLLAVIAQLESNVPATAVTKATAMYARTSMNVPLLHAMPMPHAPTLTADTAVPVMPDSAATVTLALILMNALVTTAAMPMPLAQTMTEVTAVLVTKVSLAMATTAKN